MAGTEEATEGALRPRAGTNGGTIGVRVPLPVLGSPPEPAPRPTIPECYGDVCITCSDEAIPVTIVELLADDLANVDRKSTRLNSSHQIISYAVFCLKKKNIVTT